jgi:hypothetical protein
MKTVAELAIWWLSEDECRIVMNSFADLIPTLVLAAVESMQGRPKRGRLWFCSELELPSCYIGERGGIVFHAQDARRLAFLPGYVSDTNMRPMTLLPR